MPFPFPPVDQLFEIDLEVEDACRAAYVHGRGTYGSGFLYDPSEASAALKGAGVRFVSAEGFEPLAEKMRQ